MYKKISKDEQAISRIRKFHLAYKTLTNEITKKGLLNSSRIEKL